MANTENTRLLNEEKQAAQAEAGLNAQEQGLWQRLEAAQEDASLALRANSMLSRLAALEAAGIKTPDFAKARNVLQAALSAEPPIAAPERTSAIAVRRASVQAREIATRQLAQALAQLESARGSQKRDLETIDTFLQSAERAHSQRQSREKEAKEASEQRSAAATEMMAAPDLSAPPPRAPAPVAPPPAAPASPPPAARSVSAPPPPAPKPAPVPAPPPSPMMSGELSMTTNTRIRKLSRRRRVRLAPPPKKLDVEVAVYGDNTFYTGFDNRIATGGLFVSTLETLPAGHELDLAIDLEGKKISTRGKVEFTRIDNTANPECTQGAGIKLLNLPPDAASAIESFFQKRQPLFVQTHV
jgi:Tfp pilus assembly protein PilZ